MPSLPGNRLNDLLGHGLGRLALRTGRARRRPLGNGRVTLYDGCAGPVGWWVRAINGGRDAAITFGQVILCTRPLNPSRLADRWLLAHEEAHVAQARTLGVLYLPAYLLGLLPAAALWLWRRRRDPRLLHDLHPMERAATRSANAAVPELTRWL